MSDLHPETVVPDTVPQGHEHTDVPIRPLGIFLTILATSLVVVCALVAGFFQLLFQESEQADPSTSPFAESKSNVVPGPHLQVSARDDMQTFRVREEQKIRALEWVDREKKLARIPIEQAIELTAKRGLPKWPEVPVSNLEKTPSKDKQISAADATVHQEPDQKSKDEPVKNEGVKNKAKANEPMPSSGESAP